MTARKTKIKAYDVYCPCCGLARKTRNKERYGKFICRQCGYKAIFYDPKKVPKKGPKPNELRMTKKDTSDVVSIAKGVASIAKLVS